MSDLLIFVRAVHLLATILVTGVVFFQSFVAAPALAGISPVLLARMRDRSRRLLALGLAIALMSGAAWLALLAARIGEAFPLDALGETAWTVLTQTQFGTAWQLRLVLALMLAAVVLRRERETAATACLRNSAAVGTSAIFAGTLAWS